MRKEQTELLVSFWHEKHGNDLLSSPIGERRTSKSTTNLEKNTKRN